jgi:hypothetical protein
METAPGARADIAAVVDEPDDSQLGRQADMRANWTVSFWLANSLFAHHVTCCNTDWVAGGDVDQRNVPDRVLKAHTIYLFQRLHVHRPHPACIRQL